MCNKPREATWGGIKDRRNIENLFPSSCLFAPSSPPLSSWLFLLSHLSCSMVASLHLDPGRQSESLWLLSPLQIPALSGPSLKQWTPADAAHRPLVPVLFLVSSPNEPSSCSCCWMVGDNNMGWVGGAAGWTDAELLIDVLTGCCYTQFDTRHTTEAEEHWGNKESTKR